MFLVVLIENFRLFAALRLRSTPCAAPAALADEGGAIAEVNQAAAAHGVQPGMTMPKALARCGALEVLNLDPPAERAAERVLWNCVWQISPKIELTRPGLATLQLYRMTPEQLTGAAERCLQSLRRHGLYARAGAAPTPEWAELAALAAETHALKFKPDARRMQGLLDHLPLRLLPALTRVQLEVLESWGVDSLGKLARLPRQGLGERLGEGSLLVWDQLNGRARRLLRFTELEPEFREGYALETPIEQVEAVCFLIRRAAEALAQQLAQAGKVARALRLKLAMERRPAYRKRIGLPETTASADLMDRLLRNHLEQVQLEAPVTSVALSVEPVAPVGKQAGLFQHSVRNPWRLAETLDQLAGLVGEENLGSPRRVETHRPGQWTLAPLPDELDGRAAALGTGRADSEEGFAHPPLAPNLRRYRPEAPAAVKASRGVPAAVQSDRVSGEIASTRGPFRLSGDWWQATRWAQEEWDVAVAGEGCFRLARRGPRWFVAGAYD